MTTATALAANDSIDWGQLGPDSTSLPSSTAVTSANGLAATVTTGDPTGLVRVDEGASWTGNFTIGDHLINNNQFSFSPLTLRLSLRSAAPAHRFNWTLPDRSRRRSRRFRGPRSWERFPRMGFRRRSKTAPRFSSASWIRRRRLHRSSSGSTIRLRSGEISQSIHFRSIPPELSLSPRRLSWR